LIILQTALDEKTAMLGARQKQRSGKRVILKGRILVTTEEVLKRVKRAEAATKKKAAEKSKKQKRTPDIKATDEEEHLDSSCTSASSCIVLR
jgi:uncharacterized Rossmann fold enzyme